MDDVCKCNLRCQIVANKTILESSSSSSSSWKRNLGRKKKKKPTFTFSLTAFSFITLSFLLRSGGAYAEPSHCLTILLQSSAKRFRVFNKMSNLGTSKGILEIAKFAIYVGVPIGLMYTFANNTKNLNKFMGNRSYVVYPTDGPLPPSLEEIQEAAREMAKEIARKKNQP